MIAKTRRPTLVIAGTGMAGSRVVEEVLQRDPQRFQIRMFGAAPHDTYNRIPLSSVHSEHADPDRLRLNPLPWYEERGVFVHRGVKAESIDLEQRLVVGGGGKVVEPFDYLILATGSRAFIPPLEGIRQAGVFAFRTLDDCTAITAYAPGCQRAVVMGGGLLGLEAAHDLLRHGLEVTIVETAPHLLLDYLDTTASALLQRKLEALGLRFVLSATPSKVLGEGKVSGIQFADGTTLSTDMLVLSCGACPNVEPARRAGLYVDRAIVVDDQLRTSDAEVFALGECAQHRNRVHRWADPVHEQAAVLADVLTEARENAVYRGARLAATLRILGVELTTLGEANAEGNDCEVISHLDPGQGIYKRLILRDRKLVGAILLGSSDPSGRLRELFQRGMPVDTPTLDLLAERGAPNGKPTVPDADTRSGRSGAASKNKVEIMKKAKDGLDVLEDILPLAADNRWAELTEDDKHRAKWHGLFFRKPTPGHFMLRLRFQGGQANARQFRVLADLTDEFGKGFCDLTTRQQIQLRWFTLADVEEIWRRLADVGLHSKQTGMDNVRGVCGCPVAGLTPHELLDATAVIRELDRIILGNREFTNLPRKFNVTITGCLENCCHTETQDLALVPAYRELDGCQVNGFNVLVGGKQGSGGYQPAASLDVFTQPEHAASVCADIARIFRDHGNRASRTRARLAFLIEERGLDWFRNELQERQGQSLLRAGTDLRKPHHVDHLGIHPQKKDVANNRTPHYVGMLVPVGRITTAQMRAVADLADGYGNGDIRITTGQNLIVPNIAEERIGALTEERIFAELPFDPSPILRGLVACTGTDYCGMALIETKGYALEIARELERRTAGKKVAPLTIHWSGCSAGCGLHQVATIGLQGCRSRVQGEIVDAAHVSVQGKAGPNPAVANDLMYDLPISQLADALEPLVRYLPRK